MITERRICEVEQLAVHQGPEQYLALDELAARLREDRSNWWTPESSWAWTPLDETRAPNAIEVEWALLTLSQLYNDRAGGQGADYELIATQDQRLNEIEAQLDEAEDSVELKFFNSVQGCIRQNRTQDEMVGPVRKSVSQS